AEIIESNAEAWGEELTREEGKTLAEGIGEVRRAAQILRYYGNAADRETGRIQTFRLDRMSHVAPQEGMAVPPADFDLGVFASQSFGIYQDEIEDVVLRIAPEGAVEARGWRWHPTQSFEDQSDGGVIVRFRASGMRELAWHLFTWGEQVQIL
ncbi:WYL domain-containing protein, partial [Halomonas sp. ND22Bw]|uniref:WYL domain-containing protein n=1 Tax=Halomonas sp. ND22Bw TaxID=2054178 RepID=UPI001C6283C4